MATKLTNQVNNEGLIPSTDVIKLTLTMKMTKGPVVIYVEGGREKKKEGKGYFIRLGRWGGGGLNFFIRKFRGSAV